jgi:pyrimidine-specific ribonucleoside hydrolase
LQHSCNYFQQDWASIGDAGAVASLIDPTGCRRGCYPVTVELAGLASRGQTVIDRRARQAWSRLSEWWPPGAPEVEVVEAVDGDRYRRLFATAVGAEKPL